MILISKKDVQDMLNETDELSAYAFKILDEKLQKIPTRAVYRECDGCFGASMGDCSGCRRFAITRKIGDTLSNTLDKIDKSIDESPARIKEFLTQTKYKILHGKHARWKK